MRDSLTGVGKIAALERVDQLMQKPGAMSDMEKKVRAMGFDPATPGGKRVMMQMIYMQHGSQEIKDTISEFPDITPGTPEFAEATKKRLGVKIGKAESATAASEAGTALARQRAENLEAELTQLRTRGQQIGPDPALAQQLGTTVSPTNPYAPLSGRAREDFYSKMQKQFDSENDDFREKAAKAQTFSQDGKRALALLAEPDPKAPGGFKPRITTGGVLALPGVSAVAGAFHPVYAELRAIQSRVAPSLRVVGSGATSDFDARMLQASTFGPDKPWPTNVALALGYIANAKRISDYQDAKERYFMANKHTQGFDQIWKKYANENPFLESSQEGLLIMRKGVPTFSEWLAKQPRAGQRPPVAPPTGETS